ELAEELVKPFCKTLVVEEAFVVEATKAETITNDFKAGVDSVGLDEVDILHLLDITP
ncbi:18340_t:CDS:2, partial [Racocetra persica]